MIRFGVFDLEPMSAFTALRDAFVDVEVGEIILVFLAQMTDQTPIVHGGNDGRTLAGACSGLKGLNIPRIFDAREMRHFLELLDADGVLQVVRKRHWVLLHTRGSRGDSTLLRGRGEGGPHDRAAHGCQTQSSHGNNFFDG